MGPKAKNNSSAVNNTNNNKNKSKKNKDSKSSYLAEDENFQSFSNQLAKLGLQLRDITGDGNCLFRALSDQMEGDESHHLEYRKKVCNYMRQNPQEFEPFIAALIEDIDVANERKNIKNINNFEDYLKNLEKSGTYADNGCLVAFARLYKVDINIHQLNLPIWTITGGGSTNSNANHSNTNSNHNFNLRNKNKPNVNNKQLHLSYHNNEHYSSIRAIGDNSSLPTNISFQPNLNADNSSSKTVKKYYNYDYEEEDDFKDIDCLLNNEFESFKLSNNSSSSITKDNDIILCKNGYDDADFMTDVDYDFQLKVDQIMDVTKCMDISLIRNKLMESGNDVDAAITALCTNDTEQDDNKSSAKTAGKYTKPNKTDKKREKKQRQMERQKQKVAEENIGKFNFDNEENANHSKMSDNNNEQANYSYSLNVITKAI